MRKKWNLKWIAVTICATIVVALALYLGVCMYEIYRLPEGHADATGAIVDNSYNNFIAESDPINSTGDLIRIGDKIYYNYYGSYASYGLYEITSSGAQRIHWDGHGPQAFLTGHQIMLYPIRAHAGKLLINTTVDRNYYVYKNETKEWELAQGSMQTYNAQAQTFEKTAEFDAISEIHGLTYQETAFGFVYESSERSDLWVYTREGGPERIAAEDVCAFYTVGKQIYYLTLTAADAPYELRVFDWEKKTDTVICEWANYTNIPYFIVEGNNLIFVAGHSVQDTQSVYKLDLRNPTQKETAIYTIDKDDSTYIYSWNIWNGTVYLCTQKGLIACDLDTGAHRVLCNKKTLECDIVDDTWIYFIEFDSRYLWRVPQSGGNAELVFG